MEKELGNVWTLPYLTKDHGYATFSFNFDYSQKGKLSLVLVSGIK